MTKQQYRDFLAGTLKGLGDDEYGYKEIDYLRLEFEMARELYRLDNGLDEEKENV